MTPERYRELSRNMAAALTPEEVAAGWHFCCDWDGLLINDEYPEAECCTCGPSPNGDLSE